MNNDENLIPKRIPITECMKGRVYRVHARSFEFAVYDGKTGFIGIRTKFGQRYLFTEYHWDAANFPTVRNQIDTGIDVPAHLHLTEWLGENSTIEECRNYRQLFDFLNLIEKVSTGLRKHDRSE